MSIKGLFTCVFNQQLKRQHGESQMFNRHNKTLNEKFDLYSFFENPVSPRQKQYEAIRAIVFEKQPVVAVAKKFGYQVNTVYSFLRDARAGKLDLFPIIRKGPKQKQTPGDIQDKIIEHRKKGLSSTDIKNEITNEGYSISVSTVERILKKAGCKRLKRRTFEELGRTVKNKMIPDRSEHLDFSKLEPFKTDCPSAGVFFFIPYILESGIIDIVTECPLPESSDIGATQACLSMLLLKLIGSKRLSHIGAYDKEPGFGVFAGLNVLPKSTYISTYSCRCSETQLLEFQEKIINNFRTKYSYFYKSEYINLDFKSIPHFGDESEMQKVWCGARGKTMKGANTVFAQDSKSNAIIYTRADILHNEEADEVKRFVSYWEKIRGDVNETLVFDCRFTIYSVLDELEDAGVKFIALRKRFASLLEETEKIPKNEWKKVYVAIPKRKHKHVLVHEQEVLLSNCKNKFRQIIVKNHGRSKPTYILTNDTELELSKILEVYAKRWRVENKLAELVAFFNLNALSSPIMIRIHFDIIWTMIADTLYHLLAQDLRRFENNHSQTLFKKFIDMPGKIEYDGEVFCLKIRKRAHTPILKGVKKLQEPFNVPWLDGKSIKIIWTA